MSADLDDLLTGAVARTDGELPDADATWAAGRRHRRRTQVLTGGAATIALVAAVGIGTLVFDAGPGPAPIIDEPTPTTPDPTPTEDPTPDPEPTPDATPTDTETVVPTDAPVDREAFDAAVAARWVAASADGRWLYRSSSDEVPLGPDDAVPYPSRLQALPGGAVVWQTADGRVLALRPQDNAPFLLAEAVEDDSYVTLTGTGVVDGVAVAILETSRAQSLNDDQGGAVVGRQLDGTDVPLLDLEFSWEYGQSTQVVLDGWRIDATSDAGFQRWQLVGPDNGIQILDESAEGDTGFVDATLAATPDGDAPRLVILRNQQHPEAAYGRATLEVQYLDRRENDVILQEIPALDDWIPKQLQVRGDHAWVTLLPDASRIMRIDLSTGEVAEFDAAGVVGIEPDWDGHHDPLAAPFVTSPVTFDGWGPLRLGMPRAEVEAALGGTWFGECGGGDSPPFRNVAVSYEGVEGDQRLSRIDVYWPRWREGVMPAATGGVRLGSFGDAAVDRLGTVGIDAVLEEVPDLLAELEGPEDNTELRVAATRDDRLLAWSVGDDGRIAQVRVGTADDAEFMSRCA